MFTFALLALLLLLLLLLLGLRGKKDGAPAPPSGGPGTVIRVPDFEPIPRRPPTIVEPASVPVAIDVVRDARGVPVDISIPEIALGANEQAVWSSGASRDVSAGKLEIRFSPNASPFGAAEFIVARGGAVKSGAPTKASPDRPALAYTVLLTTPDGYLLRKTARLTVRPDAAQAYAAQAGRRAPEPETAPGTVIRLPDFQPIPRRPRERDIPRSNEVRIAVERDKDGAPIGVIVKPAQLTLSPNEQIAWTTGPRVRDEGGRIEIRFAPNASPFGGDRFVTARGGFVASGRPRQRGSTQSYIVLLTTADGTLLSADAAVTISSQ